MCHSRASLSTTTPSMLKVRLGFLEEYRRPLQQVDHYEQFEPFARRSGRPTRRDSIRRSQPRKVAAANIHSTPWRAAATRFLTMQSRRRRTSTRDGLRTTGSSRSRAISSWRPGTRFSLTKPRRTWSPPAARTSEAGPGNPAIRKIWSGHQLVVVRARRLPSRRRRRHRARLQTCGLCHRLC